MLKVTFFFNLFYAQEGYFYFYIFILLFLPVVKLVVFFCHPIFSTGVDGQLSGPALLSKRTIGQVTGKTLTIG